MSFRGKQLGKKGERSAQKFLVSRGYKILESNYSTPKFEIDIIAKDNDTLCFIEVKTRTGIKKGLPREGVTTAKQKKIIMGAQYYLHLKKITDTRLRFDVVEILYKDASHTACDITIIPNAFQGS
ncbi:YraN family protein [uncultured Desulfobacter sp.]|uniref:YraN family protein n=1 Tax=uncultured Desulfobacter sp. TaxID=240139 RepID=UPI002AA6130F|nr:YraN family protein [uncultured Desulfobacter sp.]